MPPMRAPRPAPAALCLLAAGVLAAGCGSDSETDESGSGPTETAARRPAPPKSDFPSPEGRTLRQVVKAADAPAELVVEPAATAFYPGPNRYPFSVRDRDRGPVSDAEVALYYARVPEPEPGAKSRSGVRGQSAKAEAQALDEPAVGPFPAAIESLATAPRFRSQSTSNDPEAARVVYATELSFPDKGEWRLAALLKEDGELKGTLLSPGIVVGEFEKIPEVGQKAPLIHTPTAEDTGGDLAKITTRIPPDTQNEVDYADALGREPIVLLFATPEFCQSRVCGAVVDVAEQAKSEFGDEAAFIHMEIYNENDPAQQVRPQVRAFHLPSEPWLFTIDRDAVVRDTVEGAFGLKLMHRAVDKALAP
jgi:hypothetical protein